MAFSFLLNIESYRLVTVEFSLLSCCCFIKLLFEQFELVATSILLSLLLLSLVACCGWFVANLFSTCCWCCWTFWIVCCKVWTGIVEFGCCAVIVDNGVLVFIVLEFVVVVNAKFKKKRVSRLIGIEITLKDRLMNL